MNMNTSDTGYEGALEKVIYRRLEARKKYGDEWLNDEYSWLEQMLEMKERRVKHALTKDALEDSLLDLINYALFMYQRQLNGTGKYQK